MIFGDNDNGQKPLINVIKVTNGWLVVIHHHNRDKETSPETLAKWDVERQQQIIAQREREKKRIVREMRLQLANMAIIGEAAGKAQYKGIQDESEPWKRNEDEDEDDVAEEAAGETSKGALQKIEAIAQKIADETTSSDSSALAQVSAYVNLCSSGVETHIFTEREKMIDFVTKMLLPVVE